MAETSIEKSKELKPVTAKVFARYRNIYKNFLQNETVQEIAQKTKQSRQYIRGALSYMSKYNDMHFDDDDEIQIAIDKTIFRQKILTALHDDAEGDIKNNIPADKRLQLMVLKEMRKNDEMIHKLKGLLNPEFINASIGAGGNNTIIVMHNMGKKSGREVVDITPPKKVTETTADSLPLSQIKELQGD